MNQPGSFRRHARSPHRRFATGPAQPVPTVPGSFSPNTRDPRIVASRPDRRSRSLLCLVHFADTRDPPHRRFAIGPAQPVPTVHFADTLDPCIVASRPDRRSRSLLCISPTSAIPPHRRFATGPAQPVPTAFRRHARSPHRRFATGPAQPVPTVHFADERDPPTPSLRDRTGAAGPYCISPTRAIPASSLRDRTGAAGPYREKPRPCGRGFQVLLHQVRNQKRTPSEKRYVRGSWKEPA
jgi:hypothetical protein